MDAERLAEIREEIRISKGLWEYDSYGTALDPDKWPLKQIQELIAYVDDLEARVGRLREVNEAWLHLTRIDTLEKMIEETRYRLTDPLNLYQKEECARMLDALTALQPGDLSDKEAPCDEQR